MGTFFLYSLVNKSRACDQGVGGKDETGGLTVVAVGERGGQKSEERGLSGGAETDLNTRS